MQIKPFQAEAFINNIASNKDIFAVVLYGPESGLIQIRRKKIARAIVSDPNDPFLSVSLNQKQFDEDKGLLADEFAAMSMLGGRKLIDVEGGNKTTESLKMIFAEPKKSKKTEAEEFRILGDNFILIAAGELDKSSSLRKFAESSPYVASIACYEDDAATISGIIRGKLQDLKFTFDNEIVQILLEKFGKNRQIILNEIAKLDLFMGDDRNLTIEALQENIADLAEVSAFGLVEEFASRNLPKSIFYLDKLYAEKTSPIMILRFLSNYFSKLLLVKNNVVNGSNLDFEMKIQNVFFKQQPIFKRHLNIWSPKAISALLIKLQELEIKCKNNNFNGELLLGAFINFVLMKKGS
ncbi:MAG: DNA polymerase-3 subunit delta [Myxococcota bacterium]|jgi:DNA polymerase-3 subunit delta